MESSRLFQGTAGVPPASSRSVGILPTSSLVSWFLPSCILHRCGPAAPILWRKISNHERTRRDAKMKDCRSWTWRSHWLLSPWSKTLHRRPGARCSSYEEKVASSVLCLEVLCLLPEEGRLGSESFLKLWALRGRIAIPPPFPLSRPTLQCIL